MSVVAYSYLRFSSAGQRGNSSIPRQLEMAMEWAAEHPEVTLDTSLRDEGVSGSTGENRVKGALSGFLKRIEQGRIAPGSFLLIEEFDRLSRESEVIATNLLTGILMKKVKVVTLVNGEVLDHTADVMDLTKAIWALSQGHQENKKRTKRVAKAWANKKIAAREKGTILSRKGPAWCEFNDVTKRFDAVPERVEVIKGIFRDYIDGKGASVIAQELNARPVAPFTKSSKGWHAGYVLTLLKSRSLLGYYQPTWWSKTVGERAVRDADGEDIAGYYPIVLDEATFARAQHQLEKRSKHGRQGRGKRAKTTPNVLIGLAKCEECSGTLVLGNAPNSPRSRFFRCYDSSRKHNCTNKTRYYQNEVLEALEGALVAAHMADAQPTDEGMEISAIQGRLDDIKRRIKKLIDRLEDEDGDENDDIAERLKERRAERKTLERMLVEAKVKEAGARHLDRHEAVKAALGFVQKLNTLEGEELFAARAKANALLVESFDWVMPTERGVYAAQGERLFYSEAALDTFPMKLPAKTPITRRALEPLRKGVPVIESGKALTAEDAAAFKAMLAAKDGLSQASPQE